VCIVLNSPRAQDLLEAGQERIRRATLENVTDRLTHLASRAVANVGATIEEERTGKGLEFVKHQDGVSLELLSRTGFGRHEKAHAAPGLQISAEAMRVLVEALRDADEVQRLYAGAFDVQDEVEPAD
jgi:hypothetical protein